MRKSILNLLLLVAFLLGGALVVGAEEKSAEFYFKRGVEHGKKGQLDQAIADFNKALELNPRLAEAYVNRTFVYCLKKDFDKAWEDLHKTQSLGVKVPSKVLEMLRQAAGSDPWALKPGRTPGTRCPSWRLHL